MPLLAQGPEWPREQSPSADLHETCNGGEKSVLCVKLQRFGLDLISEHNLLYLDWYYSYCPIQTHDSVPLWKEIESLTGTHCLAKVEGVLAVDSGKVMACEDLRGTQTDCSFSVLSWPRPMLTQLERGQPEDETIPGRGSNSYMETLLQESYGKEMSLWTWDQQTTFCCAPCARQRPFTRDGWKYMFLPGKAIGHPLLSAAGLWRERLCPLPGVALQSVTWELVSRAWGSKDSVLASAVWLWAGHLDWLSFSFLVNKGD